MAGLTLWPTRAELRGNLPQAQSGLAILLFQRFNRPFVAMFPFRRQDQEVLNHDDVLGKQNVLRSYAARLSSISFAKPTAFGERALFLNPESHKLHLYRTLLFRGFPKSQQSNLLKSQE